MDLPLSSAKPPERPAILPVVLSALVAPRDDPRQFRRYPVHLSVGVGTLRDEEPPSDATEEDEDAEPLSRLIYRSVEIRDLSLTGGRFLSAVPYRVGVLLEIQLPLAHQLLTLPCRVKRLEAVDPKHGAQTLPFACGVNFVQSRITPDNRRALMEYLLKLTG